MSDAPQQTPPPADIAPLLEAGRALDLDEYQAVARWLLQSVGLKASKPANVIRWRDGDGGHIVHPIPTISPTTQWQFELKFDLPSHLVFDQDAARLGWTMWCRWFELKRLGVPVIEFDSWLDSWPELVYDADHDPDPDAPGPEAEPREPAKDRRDPKDSGSPDAGAS